MDDGELEFSNHEIFSSPNMGEIPGSCSMDSFFDELLKDTHACTHTHTCNPLGPDHSHTHTCFHVHTKIVSAPSDDNAGGDDSAEYTEKKSKKRPLGNREAVRKYREKKKAKAASLEDEVARLRALNQQLLKRLQGQVALETEIARLKCLLVDIRGRIEGEIGSFPYQKSANNVNLASPSVPGSYMMNPCNVQSVNTVNLASPSVPGSYVMNSCNLQCNDQLYCLHPGMDGKSGEDAELSGQGISGCDFENLQCLANHNSGAKELPGCGPRNVVTNSNSSAANKER